MKDKLKTLACVLSIIMALVSIYTFYKVARNQDAELEKFILEIDLATAKRELSSCKAHLDDYRRDENKEFNDILLKVIEDYKRLLEGDNKPQEKEQRIFEFADKE